MADRLLSDCQAGTVGASKAWSPERRTACIALLEDAARRIEEALAVWEGALANPDESGVPFTAVVHIGAERARSLQRLYFDQKALAAAAHRADRSRLARCARNGRLHRDRAALRSVSAPRSRSMIGRAARSRRCASGHERLAETIAAL